MHDADGKRKVFGDEVAFLVIQTISSQNGRHYFWEGIWG